MIAFLRICLLLAILGFDTLRSALVAAAWLLNALRYSLPLLQLFCCLFIRTLALMFSGHLLPN